MCGIAGICDIRLREIPEKETLVRMAEAMIHRGPDDEGYYRAPGIGLAHRRLSIIDLKTGSQPISNETGEIWIVFNGEIYNYIEIRKELEARGHKFKTSSDTEVIIHAYEEDGFQCLKRFNGMFAFTIWDERTRSLFCARDRLGVKPFYYTYKNGRLVFASEIKAIIAEGSYTPELNLSAVPEVFTYKYTAWDDTLFAGVAELAPAHYATLDNNGWNERRYWDLEDEIAPEFPKPSSNAESQVNEFRDLLKDSIRLRLRSDVPVGVFLSGGLDSGSLTAFTSEIASETLNTFSIGYEEEQYSELPYAREVSRKYGTRHFETLLSGRQYADYLPEAIRYKEQPLAHPASVPQYFVSKLARDKGVIVVLSGEGSDELLGGYTQFPKLVLDHRLGQAYRWVPQILRKALAKCVLDSIPLNERSRDRLDRCFFYNLETNGFAGYVRVYNKKQRGQIFTDDFKSSLNTKSRDPLLSYLRIFQQSRSKSFLNRVLYVDLRSHLVRLLKKQDKMSMAASIESRVPFLDYRMAQYCMALPSEMKVQGKTSKVILRKALGDRLPSSIMQRSKMGFMTPFDVWMRNKGPILELCCQILLDDRTRNRGQLRLETVENLIREHMERGNHAGRIFLMANFEIWMRIFLDKKM